MDALQDNPGSEQQNLDDEETNQQAQETFQVDSIMVIRNEKDAGTDFVKTPVSTSPVWLDNMLGSKKRNIVPASITMEDMVSKCLGKTPKPKKSKTVSKNDFDVDSGDWVAKIAHPLTDAKIENPIVQDFTVEKVNIGTATHAIDILHLEASTKNIITRTWKEERDKHRMKEMLRRMAEYIEVVNSLNPQPLSQLPTSFDPKSPVNQKTWEQIHKCRLIIETVMEWLEQMWKSGAAYFGNLSKVHNEAIQVMKELATEIGNWKNEEVEWATRTTQM